MCLYLKDSLFHSMPTVMVVCEDLIGFLNNPVLSNSIQSNVTIIIPTLHITIH